MNKCIRRFFTLFALASALTVGLVAHADPLPAPRPSAGGGGAVTVVPQISKIAPADGATATYANKLVWSNEVTPEKYILKFLLGSGEVVKFNVSLAYCVEDGNCTISIGETPLFDYLADGETVLWRVVGKFINGNSKTNQWTFHADTVNAPVTLTPGHGETVYSGEDLIWNHSFTNASYTLIVTHIGSGERVVKHKVFAVSCAATCSADAFGLYSYIENHGYQWFVKAKGYNGDKAKSAKQTFYPHYAAETGR